MMTNAAGPWAAGSPGGREGGIGKVSALAVWSLVLGLLAFCLWITALPGLILGILALIRIQGAKGQLSGAGLAIAGVAASGLALLVAPLALSVMIPAVSRVKERAEEMKAQAKAEELCAGLMSYFDEYGHLPVARAGPEDDVHTTSEGGLIQVLLGRSRELNPRGRVFLPDAGERLVDPWGRPFQIALDGNRDGRVTLAQGKGGSERTIEARVVVWSLGPDGVADHPGAARDDILAY